ncbi:STAS-like domain-containing protein [Flectobacillus roseus]|uniref:STAS-like domain-containing protein n=1 Tax=Flectobacillus roseus TaxID=502259 RepID=UPI0024B65F67|nr:DUF4325 domain-containing protein [Flectobacillus roseus]MDI9871092.1 DUF4325 domain-containing protein [Flectobacillus roseus]
MENIINLEDYRVTSNDGSIAKVFTGRDRGEIVRKSSHLDELETQFDHVKIIIPNNIYSINPSFFEELFINVVTKLGKEKFFEKFIFQSDEYNYQKPLNEAIMRILRKGTALG